MHAHLILAVQDALAEARVLGGLSPSEAMQWIPDEHHSTRGTVQERFVASVIANARAVGRAPYTVACMALDI
jgi:hypothetical protein